MTPLLFVKLIRFLPVYRSFVAQITPMKTFGLALLLNSGERDSTVGTISISRVLCEIYERYIGQVEFVVSPYSLGAILQAITHE